MVEAASIYQEIIDLAQVPVFPPPPPSSYNVLHNLHDQTPDLQSHVSHYAVSSEVCYRSHSAASGNSSCDTDSRYTAFSNRKSIRHFKSSYKRVI